MHSGFCQAKINYVGFAKEYEIQNEKIFNVVWLKTIQIDDATNTLNSLSHH